MAHPRMNEGGEHKTTSPRELHWKTGGNLGGGAQNCVVSGCTKCIVRDERMQLVWSKLPGFQCLNHVSLVFMCCLGC